MDRNFYDIYEYIVWFVLSVGKKLLFSGEGGGEYNEGRLKAGRDVYKRQSIIFPGKKILMPKMIFP